MEIGIAPFGTFVSFQEKDACVSFPIIQVEIMELYVTGEIRFKSR